MTTNPRMETVAKALHKYRRPDLEWDTLEEFYRDEVRKEAVSIIVGYDVLHAFDESQQKEVMNRQKGIEDNPGRNNAPALAVNPVGADPPWLEASVTILLAQYQGLEAIARKIALKIGQSAMAFAAAQPPSEVVVDAALEAWYRAARELPSFSSQEQMRATLIAAAKARIVG